jgi:hypothetical protein
MKNHIKIICFVALACTAGTCDKETVDPVVAKPVTPVPVTPATPTPTKWVVPKLNFIKIAKNRNYNEALPLKSESFFTWSGNNLVRLHYYFYDVSNPAENYDVDYFFTYNANNKITSVKKIFNDEAWRKAANADRTKAPKALLYERNFKIIYDTKNVVTKIFGQGLSTGYEDNARTIMYSKISDNYSAVKFNADNRLIEQIDVGPYWAGKVSIEGKTQDVGLTGNSSQKYVYAYNPDLSYTMAFSNCEDKSFVKNSFNVDTALPCPMVFRSIANRTAYPLFKNAPFIENENLFVINHILNVNNEHSADSMFSLNWLINTELGDAAYAHSAITTNAKLTQNTANKRIEKISQDCPGRFCTEANISYVE